jgi:hypothetical protein
VVVVQRKWLIKSEIRREEEKREGSRIGPSHMTAWTESARDVGFSEKAHWLAEKLMKAEGLETFMNEEP